MVSGAKTYGFRRQNHTFYKPQPNHLSFNHLQANGNMGAKSIKIGTKPTTATTILHVVAVAIYTNNCLSYSVESVNFNSSILQFFNEFFCEHLRAFLIQVFLCREGLHFWDEIALIYYQ